VHHPGEVATACFQFLKTLLVPVALKNDSLPTQRYSNEHVKQRSIELALQAEYTLSDMLMVSSSNTQSAQDITARASGHADGTEPKRRFAAELVMSILLRLMNMHIVTFLQICIGSVVSAHPPAALPPAR
jgi:hypothetical protein